MSERQFKAKSGSRLSDADADLFGREYARLGSPKIPDLIEKARDPTSPIHHLWEWDAEKAHQEYLEKRAGDLVRWVVPITRRQHVQDEGRAFIAVPAKVVDPEDDADAHCRYLPVADVLSTPRYHPSVVDDALTRLKAWRNYFAPFRQDVAGFDDRFSGVFIAIEVALNYQVPVPTVIEPKRRRRSTEKKERAAA